MTFSIDDHRFMSRALQLARRGLYGTAPNPRVGCVLVRGGEIVGEGWHARAGEGHAEVNALAQAGIRAQGATAYVTLEPCAHHGRTPPCADALVAAGVVRVVSAHEDPNPQVAGGGHARLRAASLQVECGLLRDEAEALNPGFLSRMCRGRPWVRLKSGVSVDARTALAGGESRWITSAASRQDVQRWRAQSSVILTGIGTVLHDDPSLTVRPEDWPVAPFPWGWPPGSPVRHPVRVVLDSALQMPPSARMLRAPGRTWVVCARYDEAKAQRLRDAGADVHCLPDANGQVDVPGVLAWLAREEAANEVLVEAGATLLGAFWARGWADEWIVYQAPVLLGQEARPSLALPSPDAMKDVSRVTLKDMRRIGSDVRYVYAPLT